MKYTIEGFSQAEALKFRRTELVNGKERVVCIDCVDLLILRWFVDFWPRMMKVEVGGCQYAWVDYKSLIRDMPILGIKKEMVAVRFKKLASFGILRHETVRNGGTFSYYGFGSEYARLIDTENACDTTEGLKNISEGVSNKFQTPLKKISEQIDSSTKDSSTKDNSNNVGAPCAEVVDYLNEKTGKNYKLSAKKTREYINARFNDGYTLDDFKTVIDNKVSEWKGTNMEQYLRPSTLFAPSHFDEYLNQDAKKSPKKSGQTRQRSVDFEKKVTEYEEPRVGSMRYDNVTGVSETYQGNGVWVQTREGDEFEDIDF